MDHPSAVNRIIKMYSKVTHKVAAYGAKFHVAIIPVSITGVQRALGIVVILKAVIKTGYCQFSGGNFFRVVYGIKKCAASS